ncbi:hypothetical protein AKJ09_05619 [Labilithrix luteola]|uniref:HTH tetR-type domain-containing protein n=1 Tax=Labilithrix luteola TaxID=1391654 RepID=A0A0K1PZJ3_9BACT|nr:hypothetical protein AKJ09_05619 [Labilithrix luteola]
MNKLPEDEVTTNLIAKTTGISVGTLYKHYPHKDAIVSDLIDAFITSDVRELRARLVASSGARAHEEAVDWLIAKHETEHQLRAVLYGNLGRLRKTSDAFHARLEILDGITKSRTTKERTESPNRSLMILAAANAMIHVLSQVEGTPDDWAHLKRLCLMLLER